MQISEGVFVAFEFFGFLSAGGVVAVDDDVVFVKLDELSAVATDGHARAGLYETMERYRCVLARFDCVDCKLRSAVNVAAHEDVGLCRLICERIRNGIIAVMEFNLRSLEQIAPHNRLTDCEDDVLRFNGDGVVLVVNGAESLGLRIDDSQALLEHDCLDGAVFVFKDFLGAPAVVD